MKTRLKITSIKSEEQHRKYLEEIERILSGEKISLDEKETLETLAILIEAYERTHVQIAPPDPIDAIKFCMLERRLKQVDLVPYIGTRSRVSEVLAHKRPLTVPMIRRLSKGLGISPDVLLQEGTKELGAESSNRDVEASSSRKLASLDFPFREIWRRGWVQGLLEPSKKKSLDQAEVVMRYLDNAGIYPQEVMFRRSVTGGNIAASASGAVQAWLARVVYKARMSAMPARPIDSVRLELSSSFFEELAHMSAAEDGPVEAVSRLSEIGIAVVFEAPLNGTSIDGASLLRDSGFPIIAMSLRHDRVDNFWFTLLHELAHVWKHLDSGNIYLDDMEVISTDAYEKEANRIARDSLIPRSRWARTAAYREPTKANIIETAAKLGVAPAIVAGRVRFDRKDFTKFSNILGSGEIGQMFSKEIN